MSDTASATENQAPALKALADAICEAHDAYLHPTDPSGFFAEAVMEHLAEAGYIIIAASA